MTNNTRHLTNLAGHSACLCPMCWSTPGARRFAKRRVRRAVRHSERSEIDRAFDDENNRDGDAAYVIHVSRLSLDNVRALRTLPDGPPWDV
jgi:hypothetical protein